MSIKPHTTSKERRENKKKHKKDGDTCSNGCILGRQNWPDLSASASYRGRSNNAKNNNEIKIKDNNKNDDSRNINKSCPQCEYG